MRLQPPPTLAALDDPRLLDPGTSPTSAVNSLAQILVRHDQDGRAWEVWALANFMISAESCEIHEERVELAGHFWRHLKRHEAVTPPRGTDVIDHACGMCYLLHSWGWTADERCLAGQLQAYFSVLQRLQEPIDDAMRTGSEAYSTGTTCAWCESYVDWTPSPPEEEEEEEERKPRGAEVPALPRRQRVVCSCCGPHGENSKAAKVKKPPRAWRTYITFAPYLRELKDVLLNAGS